MHLTPYHAKYCAYELTKQSASNRIDAFTLHQPPAQGIETGRYKIGKYVADAYTYHIDHSFAQHIIEACKYKSLPSKHLVIGISKDRPVLLYLLNILIYTFCK